MTSLQNKLENFYLLFKDLDCNVTHFVRDTQAPFMVWAEQGEDDSLHTDNHKSEQVIGGTVDFFTKSEFDGLVDDIQDILDANTLAWSLVSVMYEEETNLIHYQWNWSVSAWPSGQ